MFSCSVAADTAEIGDRAVRALHKAGDAKMFCLAGIAGRVESIESKTRDACRLLVVDACDSDCAKKTMEFGRLYRVHSPPGQRFGTGEGQDPRYR